MSDKGVKVYPRKGRGKERERERERERETEGKRNSMMGYL
jgi:hypothetical protein